MRSQIGIIAISGIIIGIILIIGTNREWKFLTDLPEEYLLCYSHSFLKKVFGKEILKPFNYLVGIALILIAAYFLITAI